jgi:hypothetical protein
MINPRACVLVPPEMTEQDRAVLRGSQGRHAGRWCSGVRHWAHLPHPAYAHAPVFAASAT